MKPFGFVPHSLLEAIVQNPVSHTVTSIDLSRRDSEEGLGLKVGVQSVEMAPQHCGKCIGKVGKSQQREYWISHPSTR